MSDEKSKIFDITPKSWYLNINTIFQGVYRVTNWNFTDNLLPQAMPRNIKGIATLKTFTNISNANVELAKLQIHCEIK
jgi:hypothetical protein